MLLKRKLKTAVAPKKAIVVKKKLTSFRVSVFTRHPSHSPLRRELPLLPFRAVVRLGSTTPSVRRQECNSIQGVKNSSSKLLMKQCFTRAGVKTADWWTYESQGNIFIKNNTGQQGCSIADLQYPIVAKSHYGSRGVGNTKLNTQVELKAWMRGKTLSNFIFERFISNMSREYRLHVTSDGCFYACRKLLRNDAPEGTWQLHDDVCSWAIETNPSFKKPGNWNLIVQDCIRAKDALGLDICAFDVMVQGAKAGLENNNPEWAIIESCSAPSFGDLTLQKYLIEIPKVLKRKYLNG